MPRFALGYVRVVDRMNYGIGRFAMYLLFVLMGVLLWSSITKAAGSPANWTLEIAQFVMVGYYILGGAWSMQEGSHVRMDLLYADWSIERKAWFDAFTVFALIFYLCVMIWGAWDSAVYSMGLKYAPVEISWLPFDLPWVRTGFMERAPTAFRPYLWPVKLVMLVGFFLMLLQAIACLIRDIATIRGEAIK